MLVVDANVLGLGLVAGLTIFLGLPVARLSNVSPRVRGMLNSLSVGILLFLLIEIAVHAFEPVEEAFVEASQGAGTSGDAVLMAIVFAAGLMVGLLSLVTFEARFLRKAASGGGGGIVGRLAKTPMERVSLMIAVGIGLHNLSEGLAIGAAAATGAMSLALFLGIGFGLHNATEGFGIAAPLAGARPSWRFLIAAGLIGGGPTFLGTLIGSGFESERVSVLFLALSAGALVYVIRELLFHGRGPSDDPRDRAWVTGAIGVGLIIGVATEVALVVAAGG
jgi:ZIP family zinc transporter